MRLANSQSPADSRSPADWRRPDHRQRALVIGLTLLAELLFLLMLLGLGPASWGDRTQGTKTDIVFVPAPAAATPTPSAATRSAAAAKPIRTSPTPPRPKLPPTVSPKPPWIEMSSEQYAAADISKLGSAGGKGKSSGGETSATAGTGPGGVTLYQAEWYRRPTDAELNGYMTRNVDPGSWAEVACRTIADNHVENCQALDESPRGSGLARAIRLAGWQFRIRPPRVDGKPLVGTWVRVHIDFTGKGE